ncbi:MAG: hypothetical protein N2C14_09910, partial [Planctomycetales bacterium]
MFRKTVLVGCRASLAVILFSNVCRADEIEGVLKRNSRPVGDAEYALTDGLGTIFSYVTAGDGIELASYVGRKVRLAGDMTRGSGVPDFLAEEVRPPEERLGSRRTDQQDARRERETRDDQPKGNAKGYSRPVSRREIPQPPSGEVPLVLEEAGITAEPERHRQASHQVVSDGDYLYSEGAMPPGGWPTGPIELPSRPRRNYSCRENGNFFFHAD